MVGKAEDNQCVCGVAQNAAHLLSYREGGDGKGRRAEAPWEDPEWCRALAKMLREERR